MPGLLALAKACVAGSSWSRPAPSVRLWVERSECFGGKFCVCYSGPLSDCEAAENYLIPRVSRANPEARFVYISPPPASAKPAVGWVEEKT